MTATWLALSLSLAALVAIVAHRAGLLSGSGAWAAATVGALTFSAAPRWGAYLVLWFAVTAWLSRLGAERKARHLGGMVAKGGRRDAWQVVANGGVFAVAVSLARFTPPDPADLALHDPAGAALAAAAAAALAAAGADTWATEAGTWWRSGAWSLRTGTTVPAGSSGAITWPGSLALTAGAASWAGAAVSLGVVPARAWAAVALGGLAGAWLDTLLGAWVQERRWCPACATGTERAVHGCGAATVHAGGLAGLGNDAVNVLATLGGALVGGMLAR